MAWIDLEYMRPWQALALFAALAAPIVFLGLRSMAGLGPVRKWVAIGLRLAVIFLIVMILGGVRWKREHKTVEVLVLRDISQSAGELYRGYPGKNLDESIDEYLQAAADEKNQPSKDDRIGVISFHGLPLIDSMSNTKLVLDSRAIRERGQSTDIAGAIQLALATFAKDSMRRIVLISDGNQTAGDIEGAIAAANAQNVPIDVMPLSYAVQNEVMVERVAAPSWRREPDAFDIFVSLVSTNLQAVTGTLTIFEEGRPIDKRAITITGGELTDDGKVEPRKHVERVHVPALRTRGVRRFTATFTPDHVNTRDKLMAGQKSQPGDTQLQNNQASAFTFVQGQGRVLYVDNAKDGAGKVLRNALTAEKVELEVTDITGVPDDLVRLQDYDAIILHNVPKGHGGLGEMHDKALARYVHDFGGGLVMVGGPDALGAGGWQGSKIEEVMPINFDIPAQRQLPKGALVLVIHSCEMPNGNYWGEQCAIKAVETLSYQDEIGVVSFGNNWGAGINGSVWNHILAPKYDGTAAIRAIKQMTPMDMPSFDDCLKVAIHGVGPNQPCLKNSSAAQKHIIIISDGDPVQNDASLIQDCLKNKISISTISVYPHGNYVPPTMKRMADQTNGRYYGPIENNPGQLPQIFIKEATVVRRTLIQEKPEGIAVAMQPSASDIMKGITDPPPITGLVLSARKNNPTIEMPLVASVDGTKNDPLFAHWQAGLGKSAVFASDATPIWNADWLKGNYAGMYGKFWSQVVRGVSRPPMSQDLAVSTERRGDRAIITVEATKRDAGFTNFLNITGHVFDPENEAAEIRLVQTAPGVYTGEFPADKIGNYVVRLGYTGPDGQQGLIVSGVSVNQSPEMRELSSNDLLMAQIAERTRGRVLPAWEPDAAGFFVREGLHRGTSPLPMLDILLPLLLALILLDVAARRIAWDWESTKRMLATAQATIRSFTTTRQIEAKPTLDALKKVREEVAETRLKGDAPGPPPLPDAKAKFEAKGKVEGDITSVVGGATAKPMPAAARDPKPKGAPAAPAGGHTGSLLEAKRRAQDAIKKKQEGE